MLGGNGTDCSQWNEKQLDRITSLFRHTSLRTKIQCRKDRERDPGLHKNVDHAYSQDALSFILRREREGVYTEI